MNIKQLSHLLALAEARSFAKAADAVFLSQSAYWRSIQSLEAELGEALVDRIGKRNELTPYGRQVVEGARTIVREVAELRRGADASQGRLGDLRVALSPSMHALLTKPFLRYAAGVTPRFPVTVSLGSAEAQLTQLRDRRVDVMVVDARRIVPASDLKIEPLIKLRTGLLCAANHPLAKKTRLKFQQLTEFPIVSTPLSDELSRLMVERYGVQANPAEFVSIRCDDMDALVDAAMHSQALYFGIVSAARAELDAGGLVPVRLYPALDIRAQFAFVTLRGRTHFPSVDLFKGFAKQLLRD